MGMDLGIAGKVALVTGGSRGLGRGAADALAAEGVKLVLAARAEGALAEAAAALTEAGVEVATMVVDVTEPEAPQRLVDLAVERFGSLDIVVANAGGPPPGRALDLDDAAIIAALNANLLTSVRLVRSAVPVMAEHGWGRICCITSYSVVQPIPTLALSNTARVGLWAWAKTAANDLAAEGTGITLNLACPGLHATERMRDLGGDGLSGPMVGDPADFGKVVAFLCSDPARFVNGAAVVVDGGATLAL
jgi:3-oxoacyl-[acyl-carrier protein] reductase